MSETAIPARTRASPPLANWRSRHWLWVFLVVYGLWVWLPWVAPLFMRLGWLVPGKALYLVYSLFCHQLPERSFFLFGPKLMYPLGQIQAAWQTTDNPFILRRFIGNTDMGWKVAWSDRMVSFYGGIWFAVILWILLRRRLKPMPWWGLLLFLLPIAADGGTHMVSDLAGIGQGFRDTNAWLAVLTGHALPASFYGGDGLGSFNSTVRLITGLPAAVGIVWFGFPYLEEAFGNH
jgi:uncharacterized membrane protein